MPKLKNTGYKYLKTKIADVEVYIFIGKAKDIVKLGYVAERGIKAEKAAVQRIFSKKRIKEISDYVSGGGQFFGPFILNWNHAEKPKITKNKITLSIRDNAAQLIDGQHRYRGIQMAMEERRSTGNFDVFVMMAIDLSTRDAANIFTNINSKQQSVSKSLIYDLFKDLEDDKNHPIIRASDIAEALNVDPESPYKDMIIYPGKKARSGMIQLSAVIDAISEHVEKEGSFDKRNLKSLEAQKNTIKNFFKAISLPYEQKDMWTKAQKNPFLSAAGFRAAIEVLASSLLDKSAEMSSVSVDFFAKTLSLDPTNLPERDEDYKKLGGKEQVKYLVNFLSSNIHQRAPSESEYDFSS